jgi:glycine cleavage system H protein
MSHPADNKYTKSHEFIKPLDGNRARVGVTFHAQSELGDITFVELPEIGAEYKKGDAFSVSCPWTAKSLKSTPRWRILPN